MCPGPSDGVALGCVRRTVVTVHGSDYVTSTPLRPAGLYPGLARPALCILLTCQISFYRFIYTAVVVSQLPDQLWL